MGFKKCVEPIKILADDLQVPIDDDLRISQSQGRQKLTWRAVTDGRVVLKRCKFSEKTVVTCLRTIPMHCEFPNSVRQCETRVVGHQQVSWRLYRRPVPYRVVLLRCRQRFVPPP